MEKSDFKIEPDGQKLTVFSHKTNHRQEANNANVVRREFSYKSFCRTFQLAKDVVEAEKVAAKYEDGILRISIPKKEEARQKPPRMIKIA